MKLSALKKRAKEAEVDEAKLEEADDAEDIKAAVVELIVERARQKRQGAGGAEPAAEPEAPREAGDQPSPAAAKPHFAAPADSGPRAAHFKSLFGGKHCMFSYNWAVQEEVKAARSSIAAEGVPTWMDIDGESPDPRAVHSAEI